MTVLAFKRKILFTLLARRRDKRYRHGLLQGAVSFGVISDFEWTLLMRQIGDPEPKLPGEESDE